MKWLATMTVLVSASFSFANSTKERSIPLTTFDGNTEYIAEPPVSTKVISRPIRKRQVVATFDSKTIKVMGNPFFYTLEWNDLQEFSQFKHANRLMVYTYGTPAGVLPEDLKAYLDTNNSSLAGNVSSTISQRIGMLNGPQSNNPSDICARYQIEDVEFFPDAQVFPKRLGQFQDASFSSESIKILGKLDSSLCEQK